VSKAIGSSQLERLLSIQVRIHALNREIKSPFDEAVQDILELLLEEVRGQSANESNR
jgi:hypothetical protein